MTPQPPNEESQAKYALLGLVIMLVTGVLSFALLRGW
jgi:hypothetical protein